MAPLLQLAVQYLLGSSPISNLYSQNGVQWPISDHADGKSVAPKLHSAISLSSVFWGPHRSDIFGIGPNKDIRHKYGNDSGWHPSADTFESLGGLTLSPPTAVSWGPNQLNVFAVGADLSLQYKLWDGSRWRPSITGWAALGGRFNVGNALAATSWGVNRLDVFGVGPDGYGRNPLLHKFWAGSNWYPLGGQLENFGGDFISDPAVASWGPDRLDVFVVDTKNKLNHIYWEGQRWKWEIVGEDFANTPTAVSWGENRVDVFALRTNGALSHKYLIADQWVDWEDLGGEFSSAVGVTSWIPNTFAVVGLGPGSAYYYKSWYGGRWVPSQKGWESKNGNFTSAPSVGSWGSERIDIFGVKSDGNLGHQAWNSWTNWLPSKVSWETLGGPLRSF